MSVITVFEPVPSRVRALTRIVAKNGAMPRSDLQACIIPVGEGKQFGVLIRETVRLGLLCEDKGQVHLGANVKAKDVLDDRLFVDLTNRALIEKSLPVDDDNHPVAFAFAWLLARRPSYDLEWRGEHKSRMLEDMDGDAAYDVTNADRAAMLASWARFLGYAVGLNWSGKSLVVPDPTEAITRYLNSIFNGEKNLTIAVFLNRLAKLCPILEGGTVRNEVEARFRQKRAKNTLSAATSLALLRLDQRKIIKLSEASDAEIMLLDLMHDTPRRVSNIARVG